MTQPPDDDRPGDPPALEVPSTATDGPDLAHTMIARAKSAQRAAATGSTPSAAGGSRSRSSRTTGNSYSGAGQDGRDPQSVEAVLQRWVRDHGFEQHVAEGGLAARWGEIVGPQVAEHVTPDGVRATPAGRELVLRADSTAWATQVKLLLPQVTARLEEALGRGVVDRIAVVGPAPPRRSPGPRRVPGPGPRDTYG